MSPSLTNQVALVTGASRGLGKAIARHLAAEGARVWATSRSWEPATRAPEAGEVQTTSLNVDSEQSVMALFRSVQQLSGRLNILVNNAGIAAFKPVIETSLEEWEGILRTNLTGAFLCAREAFRMMTTQGGGRIINIGSIAGYTPIAENGAYGASKFGLHALSHILNEEGKAASVRVSVIHPGAVRTEMTNARFGFDPADMLSPDDVAQSVLDIARRPLHVRIDEVRIVPPKGLL